jgi:ParB-like chromosome segregation protein Spo0J
MEIQTVKGALSEIMRVYDCSIEQLKPYELNAKRHSQRQIQSLSKIISEFGFKVPLVIDKNSTVVAGHGRLEAAKLIGLKKVPCVIASDLSEKQIRAYRILDNKISETSWENDILKEEFETLDFNFNEFDIQFEGIKETDFCADSTVENKTEYLIVIDCKNESTQRDLFEELETRGFACKLMM